MDEDALLGEEPEGELLVGARRRRADDRGPAGLGGQDVDAAVRDGADERGAVPADAGEDRAPISAPAARRRGAASCTGVATDR